MSTLIVPWVAFPLLLSALSLGCGLLLEWASGLRLPGTLLLPAGMSVFIVFALLATMHGAIAELAPPAVALAAVAGFVLSVRRSWTRLDSWSVASAVGVFTVYAAPVVLSGRATFPGYIKLDDDATFLANLDRIMHHGRSLAGLEPSTYLATLQPHLGKGYPLGSMMPIGVGREIVGGDAIWLYHPCVAVMAALLALALYELTRRIGAARWLRALAAFTGAQAALLFGYALWGGLKEVAGAATVALAAALFVTTERGEGRLRSVLPLAVVTAALLGILSAAAVVWLAPALVATLVALVATRGWRTTVRATVAFVIALVMLALPTLVASPSFLANRIFEFDYLANLVAPLNAAQIAGIWPTGDFRFTPDAEALTYVLALLTLIAAGGGVWWAVVRRAWELPLYVGGVVVSCFFFFPFSTPWIEGKALATASTALPVAAIGCCPLLFARGRRVEGSVLAGLVAGGVLWSNVLQYHEAWLAPRAQLSELAQIGQTYAGQGPALMTEFNPYGVRHFLRTLEAEGAGELRIRPIPLRTGQLLQKGGYADLDEFGLDGILVYRTLVLRRSPLESRPPSAYERVSRGRFYEVWQRPETGGTRILEHLPLGDPLDPAAVPQCDDVLRLARAAGSAGRLAAVERPAVVVAQASRSTGDAETVDASVDVPAAGRYGIWLGGSFRDALEVSVDGRRASSLRHQLNNQGQYTPLGEADLSAGRHTVTLRFSGADLRPGSGGPPFGIGPLVLSTATSNLPVTVVRPAYGRSLCGRRLDWVEAVR
jgi:hypothetical protein